MTTTTCLRNGTYNTIQIQSDDAAVDFLSYCITGELPPLCVLSSFMPTTQEQVWNCSLCGSDKAYFIPVQSDDYLYFQFREHDYRSASWKVPTYTWDGAGGLGYVAKLFIDRGCTGEFTQIDSFTNGELEAWCGINKAATFNVQNIKAKVSALGLESDCCFQLKFQFFNDDSGNQYITYYSQYYKTIDCEDTVQIEGLYSNLDCAGFYYGETFAFIGVAAPGVNAYSNITRVYGKLTRTGSEYEKEIDEFNTITASKQNGVYELKGRPIPPFMADTMQRVLGGSAVSVDSLTETLIYKDGTFSKGIEYNRMWRLKLNLATYKCQMFFGCETN